MALWNGVGQVANIAQLTGLDAYGLITMIVEAAQTVRRNKETCTQLARRVKMIGDLLQELHAAQLMQHPETRNPVEQLEETLRQAYMLVASCQGSTYVYRCFTGSKLADQLREVQDEIAFYLQLFPLVSFVDTTRTWVRILNSAHPLHADAEESLNEAQMINSRSGQTAVQDMQLVDVRKPVGLRIRGATEYSTVEEQQIARPVENTEELGYLSVDKGSSKLSVFRFSQLVAATKNFSRKNMVAEGGFGCIHKGKLPDGLQIAVKRYDASSFQGSVEFQSEIVTLENLQHKNIIRLLGFCNEGKEQILVYEYMPNDSLSSVFNDSSKMELLTWSKRLRIIEGIADGLLYLYEQSHMRIVHRDIKSSNILLDNDMNPKISDFGLAIKLASNVRNTMLIRGTGGYIDPHYVTTGNISLKTDVYSFGIVLLEIISGRMSRPPCGSKNKLCVFEYAIKLWEAGKLHEFIDPLLGHRHQTDHIIKCIQVALLCIEESPADRPTMSDIVTMLRCKSVRLPAPKQPSGISWTTLTKFLPV